MANTFKINWDKVGKRIAAEWETEQKLLDSMTESERIAYLAAKSSFS